MGSPSHKSANAVDSDEPFAGEIARLELLRRLTQGAAHTMNNALTAILGETLCLADERKSDPLVADACMLIQGEVERCARLTRAVASSVQRRESVLEETSLAGLLRHLEPLLRETVSRCVSIDIDAPDPDILVRGPGEDLEILVLLVAHRLTQIPGRATALRITLGAHDHREVELFFELRADDATPLVPDVPDPWGDLVTRAEAALGDRHGVRIEYGRGGCASLVFSAGS